MERHGDPNKKRTLRPMSGKSVERTLVHDATKDRCQPYPAACGYPVGR